MHVRVRGLRVPGVFVVAVSATATLALPSAAGAATRVVEAGPFGSDQQRQFQRVPGDANAYFRRVTTIRKGDRVRWDINGFHTVTFVPRGDVNPGLIVPDEDATVSGVLDPAGAPFWFNGQDRLVFNPTAAGGQGGANFRPDRLLNSGLPLEGGAPEPYTLRFNRTGRFRYLCLVHPGMEGAVRVVGRRASVLTAAAHRRQAEREQRILLRQVKRLGTGLGTSRLQNTVQAGNDNRQGATVFKYFPGDARVTAGTTLELRMSPRTTDAHTFTFGPSNGENGYIDQLLASFITPAPGGEGPPTLVIDPRAGYPSENPAAGVPDYTGGNHGNGFYNSGVLDRDPNTPSPASVRVRFAQAGTYQYLCLLHPFMRGQVTVTG